MRDSGLHSVNAEVNRNGLGCRFPFFQIDVTESGIYFAYIFPEVNLIFTSGSVDDQKPQSKNLLFSTTQICGGCGSSVVGTNSLK